MFEHVLVIVLAAIVVFALVIGLACLRKKLVDEANEIGQWLYPTPASRMPRSSLPARPTMIGPA